MSLSLINRGESENDTSAESVFSAFGKCNTNATLLFEMIYALALNLSQRGRSTMIGGGSGGIDLTPEFPETNDGRLVFACPIGVGAPVHVRFSAEYNVWGAFSSDPEDTRDVNWLMLFDVDTPFAGRSQLANGQVHLAPVEDDNSRKVIVCPIGAGAALDVYFDDSDSANKHWVIRSADPEDDRWVNWAFGTAFGPQVSGRTDELIDLNVTLGSEILLLTPIGSNAASAGGAGAPIAGSFDGDEDRWTRVSPDPDEAREYNWMLFPTPP